MLRAMSGLSGEQDCRRTKVRSVFSRCSSVRSERQKEWYTFTANTRNHFHIILVIKSSYLHDVTCHSVIAGRQTNHTQSVKRDPSSPPYLNKNSTVIYTCTVVDITVVNCLNKVCS